MNKLCLVGRLATDPELSYTPSGLAVAEFRIAVKDPFREDKERPGERATDFFTVKVWRQSAEFAANNLSKGSLIALSGRLSVDNYTTNAGDRRTFTYVTADHLDHLAKPGNGSEGAPRQEGAGSPAAGEYAPRREPAVAATGGSGPSATPATARGQGQRTAAPRSYTRDDVPAEVADFVDPFADQ